MADKWRAVLTVECYDSSHNRLVGSITVVGDQSQYTASGLADATSAVRNATTNLGPVLRALVEGGQAHGPGARD